MTGSNPTPEAQPNTPAPGSIPPYVTPSAPQGYANYTVPQTGYAQQPQTVANTPYSMPLTDAYQQHTIAAQYQPQRWNGMAIAGFVCSFFISIVGLILSIIGLKQTKERNEKGHGLALAGVIISAASMAIAVILVVVGFAFVGATVSNLDDYANDNGYSYTDNGSDSRSGYSDDSTNGPGSGADTGDYSGMDSHGLDLDGNGSDDYNYYTDPNSGDTYYPPVDMNLPW